MAAKDKTPGELMTRAGANDNTHGPSILPPNSGEAQRQRVLARLRIGPATTIELRREQDVMMPAARVHELRHKLGYNIHLHWIEQATDCGQVHRVGLYELRPGDCAVESMGAAA